MKNQIKYAFILLFISFCTYHSFGQESVNSAGGEANGAEGTVSYSVGQVVYTTLENGGNTVAQGVQQAFQQEEVPIPTLSQWGLICLFLLLVIAAIIGMKERISRMELNNTYK